MREPLEPGMEPQQRSAGPSPSLSASSTAFVISSTNRGMPSVRSTISAITSAGSSLLPTRRSMMVAASRSPSRLSVRLVTCGWPTHGALNSGRKVTMSSAGRVLIRSTARPNASKLVGSVQCASSKIISTGCWLANPASCAVRASSVLLSALLRSKVECGIASIVWERQHLGEQRGILFGGRGLCQQRIELVELRLRGVVVRQSGGTFHLADDRIKRAVGMLRRAEITQARVRFGSEAFQ